MRHNMYFIMMGKENIFFIINGTMDEIDGHLTASMYGPKYAVPIGRRYGWPE
jgi:hypothetical protein